MMEPNTSKNPEAAPTTGKNAKSGKKPKAKVAKESKPKKDKAPREPLVVFAFRLTEGQRDQIHRAAGPAKATKFVRTAALAAASGDRPAFEELLAQAKANLR
jgi:hypothetical protein